MSDSDRNAPASFFSPRPPAAKEESAPRRPGLLSNLEPGVARQWVPAPVDEAPPAPSQEDDGLPKVSPFVGDPLDLDDDADVAELVSQTLLPSDERDKFRKVEDAIRRLREKMAAIAIEFAEGRINQAQFEAIYDHFQEKRAITESLLARDPDSAAWQQVLSEGGTAFLRQKFEAALEGYVLYLNKTAKPILRHGEIKIESQALMDTLKRLRATQQAPGIPQFTPVAEDRWLVYVPGRQTTAIAVYENEPPAHQIDLIGDLHRDFETVNRGKLAAEPVSLQDLVYPQRSLFEQD